MSDKFDICLLGKIFILVEFFLLHIMCLLSFKNGFPFGFYIAPGYAYGLKMAGAKTCVGVYFGDGAAQEGDTHAAMSFATTLKCPVVFFWSVINLNYTVQSIFGPGKGKKSLNVS